MAKVWNVSGVDRTVTIPSTSEVLLVKAGDPLEVPADDVNAFTEQTDIWQSERSKAAKKAAKTTTKKAAAEPEPEPPAAEPASEPTTSEPADSEEQK